MAEKYDDVLVPFVSLMRKELHANSRKGDRPGWLAMDANTALLEVYWHVAKLSAAVKNNDGPAIMEHSADVANMAMMVLDICGGLAWVEAEDATSVMREALHLIASTSNDPGAREEARQALEAAGSTVPPGVSGTPTADVLRSDADERNEP